MASLNLKGRSVIYYTQLILFIKILLLYQGAWSLPVGSDPEGPGDGGSSWILFTALSIGSVLTLVLLVFGCGAAGCCGLSKIHWFGRTRQNTPMSFDNPAAEGGTMTMMTPLSQIDVRALELDPVVFEPLPTIHDLTPLSNQSNNNTPAGQGSGGDGSRMSHSQKSLPTVIPFAADDSDLYAHDWFDETFRNFPRGNIEYVREIGKGWFGQVIEAEARDIVPFARKIRVLVKVLREDASGIEQMRFLDESRLYRDANHGNVLKLLGHSIEKLPFLLIMEHCPQGDLKSYLIANVTRAEILSNQGALIRMALDIAKGLEWMASADFIHHDLAARNCQVGSEGRIIIGDYGLGTQVFKDDYYWNSNAAIPLRWAAPETLHCTISTIQTLKVTKPANIWTFAVVVWEIVEFAKLPYFELSDEEVISRVIADKNYFLGQPTLPYIPLKEELYEIMRSCWATDPGKRPTFSSIVGKLQSLLSSMHLIKTPPRDEFDSKWDQLGAPSSSNFDEDKPRKKSVSFTGLLQQNQKSESTPDRSFEVVRNLSDSLALLEDSHYARKPKDSETQELPSLDAEEDNWLKRLERGDIAQKVLEKSHSVQDLMVLTHVEPSELDADSLPYISRAAYDNDTAYEGGVSQISDYSSSLRKSLSETALNSFTPSSSTNDSSQVSKSNNAEKENVRGSNLLFPDITLITSMSHTTPNKTGIDVTLIQPTPDPGIAISVIQPTPLPAAKIPQKETPSLPLSSKQGDGNRKVQFVFKDTPTLVNRNGIQSGRRHTSTPKRSGSSPLPPPEELNQNMYEDVFDIPETTFDTTFNTTCNISPISLKSGRGGTNPGEMISTVLVGANDDFGLDAFQGVTSQLNEASYPFHEADDNEERFLDHTISANNCGMLRSPNCVNTDEAKNGTVLSHEKQVFNHSPFGADLTVLGQVSNGGALSLTPRPRIQTDWPRKVPPRVLFADETNSEGNSTINNSSLESAALPSVLAGDSWEAISSVKTDPNSSTWEVISKGEINSSGILVDSCISSSRWQDSVLATPQCPQGVEPLLNNPKSTAIPSVLAADSCDVTIKTGSNSSTCDMISKDHINSSGQIPATKIFEPVFNESDDGGDFWNQQLRSMQDTANSTRSLFERSLCEDEEYKMQGDKFVEDIEAANEELGSLVLHDLEDTAAPEKVVPSTREMMNSPKKEVKLAFLGDDVEVDASETLGDESINGTAVQKWDVNSSVELKKSKGGFHTHFGVDKTEMADDSDGDIESREGICTEFVPSKWNQSLAPARPAIKSPAEANPSQQKSSLRKSVSFERKKPQLVYEYPPPPPISDSDEEDRLHRTTKATFPISCSLDWEMTQEDLEDAEIHHEDWDEEVIPKADPMDVYRISGVEEETFHVRGSSEPFVFQPSTLGELRHTRDRLKLDLSRGEASLLDEEATKGAPVKLDSGVGSCSTNVSPSPFNHCDMLPKSNSKNQEDNIA